jgi:hypothetical protein
VKAAYEMRKSIVLIIFASLLALAACNAKSNNAASETEAESQTTEPAQTEEPKKTGEPWSDAKQDNSSNEEPGLSEELQETREPVTEEYVNDYIPINNEATRIAMATQIYDGDNIVEIPEMVYDHENPELSKFNGQNLNLEAINRIIEENAKTVYNEFMVSHNPESESIEIKTYPFSSENYLQFVVTVKRYPNYGTDGDIFSGNFDIYYNRDIITEDMLLKLDLTQENLTEKIKGLFSSTGSEDSIESVEFAGFLLEQGPEKNLTKMFLEIQLSNPETEGFKVFYQYVPETGELSKLDADTPFDPAGLDQMDPPLHYALNR